MGHVQLFVVQGFERGCHEWQTCDLPQKFGLTLTVIPERFSSPAYGTKGGQLSEVRKL